ncbi:MAG: hypothetical protein ACRC46_12650 [Thermoguttaceae bacterium]
MKNHHDFNEQFGALIVGAAVVSAIATGSLGVGFVVGIGLCAASVYSGAIRR